MTLSTVQRCLVTVKMREAFVRILYTIIISDTLECRQAGRLKSRRHLSKLWYIFHFESFGGIIFVSLTACRGPCII